MRKLFPILFLLTACSYNINLIHTEGVASDVVDETQTPTTDISPTVNMTNGPTAPIHVQPRGLNGPMQPIS